MPGELFEQFKAGEPLELCIDVAAQRRLSEMLAITVLRDEITHDLVVGHESDKTAWKASSEEDLLDYAATLSYLLGLSPSDADSPQLKTLHIRRAAEIGFGLSEKSFTGPVIDSISALQEKLGWEVRPAVKFQSWEQRRCLVKARRIFPGKPTIKAIEEAARQGTFPGKQALKNRFGTLLNFYERLGYINPYGWTDDDYVDWGVAYKLQNGLDADITWTSINYLSGRGVGPHWESMTRKIGITELNRRALQMCLRRAEERRQLEATQAVITERLCAQNPILKKRLLGKEAAETLHISAQYQVVQEELPYISQSEKAQIAAIVSGDNMVKAIRRFAPHISAGEIEVTAAEMGIFDLVWPQSAYRFQNVDLHPEPRLHERFRSGEEVEVAMTAAERQDARQLVSHGYHQIVNLEKDSLAHLGKPWQDARSRWQLLDAAAVLGAVLDRKPGTPRQRLTSAQIRCAGHLGLVPRQLSRCTEVLGGVADINRSLGLTEAA